MSFYKATVPGNDTTLADKPDTADFSIDKENNDAVSADETDTSDSPIDKENNDAVSADETDTSDSPVDKENNDAVSADETDTSDSPMDKEDNDIISMADIFADMNKDTETLVLSDDSGMMEYIAVTDTCISFGIFFLIGLLLAKITWGRLR